MHFKALCIAGHLLARIPKQTLLAMKLTVLLIAAGLCANAESFAQKVTLSLANAPLEQVFNQVKLQTGFSFIWDETTLKGARTVNINVKNVPISEVMDYCLKDQSLVYQIIGKIIVIKQKTEIAGTDAGIPDVMPLPPVDISGRVTNAKDEPLEGVSVTVKGTQTGTTTNADGRFQLSLPSNSTELIFSFVGYATQTIKAGSQTIFNIVMEEAIANLSDVVVVGYGTQKGKEVTGSISTVEGKQLTTAPVASVTNMLAGRLPGLISVQPGGQPGFDAANLSIRGFGNALVIVDGVESNFNTLDANQIESISILKDAAASIYGSRAGNGVILVTTKRGNSGKPTITLNSSYTLQGITTMPKPANSGQYAEMAREEWIQSGRPEANAPFTEEQISKYFQGGDPLYPNTNWHDVLIRDWAPQQQHNLSVRGGNDRIRYYGFLGYLDQGTMWKNGGGGYKRYNFQSNIDAKILDNLSFNLTVASTVENYRFPERPESAGTEGLWLDYWLTLPIYPAALPDPTKISYAGAGGVGGVQVTSNRDINGYNNTDNQNLNGTLSLNYNSKKIKGLSAKAFVNYSQYYSTNKRFLKPVKFYTYDPASEIYTLVGSYGSQAQLSFTKNQGTTITQQFSLNYDRTFASDHHITFLALYEAINYTSEFLTAARSHYLTSSIDQLFAGSTQDMSNNGYAAQMGRKSYVGRLNYDYQGKYLVQGIIRTDASAKFPPGRRWGYFPGASLGWRLSEENFMKTVKSLDELKLRVSYGQSGIDDVGNYQYLSGYNLTSGYGGTYVYGAGGAQQGLVSKGLANPDLTWEKVIIYNAGIDFSVFNRKLYGSAEAFYRELDGIPATRVTTLPSSFGASLPPENINSQNNRGFELKLGTSGKLRDVSWDISGNISWSRAKWGHFEEPGYTDADQERINKKSGQWTDMQIGYLTDGLFTSQSQIDDLPYNMDQQQNVTLRPGDLVLKDVNKDGIVDWRDQVEIGKGTIPHWMMGLNINLQYKGFDFSALFQGAMGYYTYLIYNYGGQNYPAIMYDLRWSEKNNDSNAMIARLGGAPTNSAGSDYYYKKAGYVRLKNLSVGYNLPKHWLTAAGISQVRIYAAGTNLLTFDKLKKFDLDPEAPSSLLGRYYPQQKTISFGVNVSF